MVCVPQRGRGLQAEVCTESTDWLRPGGVWALPGAPRPALLCRQQGLWVWGGGRDCQLPSSAWTGGWGGRPCWKERGQGGVASGWDGRNLTAQSCPAQALGIPASPPTSGPFALQSLASPWARPGHSTPHAHLASGLRPWLLRGLWTWWPGRLLLPLVSSVLCVCPTP